MRNRERGKFYQVKGGQWYKLGSFPDDTPEVTKQKYWPHAQIQEYDELDASTVTFDNISRFLVSALAYCAFQPNGSNLRFFFQIDANGDDDSSSSLEQVTSCPMCQCEFPANAIVDHAWRCKGV